MDSVVSILTSTPSILLRLADRCTSVGNLLYGISAVYDTRLSSRVTINYTCEQKKIPSLYQLDWERRFIYHTMHVYSGCALEFLHNRAKNKFKFLYTCTCRFYIHSKTSDFKLHRYTSNVFFSTVG